MSLGNTLAGDSGCDRRGRGSRREELVTRRPYTTATQDLGGVCGEHFVDSATLEKVEGNISRNKGHNISNSKTMQAVLEQASLFILQMDGRVGLLKGFE